MPSDSKRPLSGCAAAAPATQASHEHKKRYFGLIISVYIGRGPAAGQA
jgi:hypothetical protein